MSVFNSCLVTFFLYKIIFFPYTLIQCTNSRIQDLYPPALHIHLLFLPYYLWYSQKVLFTYILGVCFEFSAYQFL